MYVYCIIPNMYMVKVSGLIVVVVAIYQLSWREFEVLLTLTEWVKLHFIPLQQAYFS